MTPSEEIMQFLKDNPTFYLATVDGYLPRVRPLGFAMWYKDHLCLGIGKHKAAYKQLLDNTNLEICTCNEKGEFLRVQGTANFDPRSTGRRIQDYAAAGRYVQRGNRPEAGYYLPGPPVRQAVLHVRQCKGHHGLLSDKQNKSKTNARAFRLWGAHGRFILYQNQRVLSKISSIGRLGTQ